ncbi:MAG: Unknown protein [uncultured Aureispira sp.]|uniref:Uncharacterized protein n=1 Tax=uncultured Aureispira sp. TaxID=1331704 RepID=A0A6S6TST8_9BACT|nr:MAG: Unknown protein [uncultured Aureispira sp.]
MPCIEEVNEKRTINNILQMKIALNILLTLAAIGLIYLLVESIRKPINFTETRDLREEFVRERLTQAAELQKVYKSLRGNYAESYDSLKYALTNDTFLVDKVIGDKYDTTTQVKIVQIKFPAKDSLLSMIKKKKPNMTIDEFFDFVSTVPFSEGKKFYIKRSEAIVEGTDSMMTSTFEIGTTIGTYLSEFDSASHVIYDPEYNPNELRKVGDLYKPSTNGNW